MAHSLSLLYRYNDMNINWVVCWIVDDLLLSFFVFMCSIRINENSLESSNSNSNSLGRRRPRNEKRRRRRRHNCCGVLFFAS